MGHRFHKVGGMRLWAFLHCRDACEMEGNLKRGEREARSWRGVGIFRAGNGV